MKRRKYLNGACVVLVLAAAWLGSVLALAQSGSGLAVPAEWGRTVNGFQDDFEGPALNSNWLATGSDPSVYSVNNGVLRVTSAQGDPNHLLYARSGYDNSTQEVLARIRILNFGIDDPPRCGVAVAVDPTTSEGIDLHFRDNGAGRQFQFLDDMRQWGPTLDRLWETNQWYWLRLRQATNESTGLADAFAKVWLADGSEAEPDTWVSWDYVPNRTGRTGLAGIAAGSQGGPAEFEVDYFLIKAAGLPSIKVAIQAFPLVTPGPPHFTQQPQSVSVHEGQPAAFNASIDGTLPIALQWFKNGESISGAISAAFLLPAAVPSDHGSVFYLMASNELGVAASSNATLTVISDTTPPSLLWVTPANNTSLTLAFSEPLDLASATNSAHYALDGGISVVTATLGGDGQTVTLTTSPMTMGKTYALLVTDLRDRSAQGNVIAANTRMTFTLLSLIPQDLGNPTQMGSVTGVANGFDVLAGGADLGGTTDQGFFSYQARTGDFDVQVRLVALSPTDVWSKAGLMARESLVSTSRFAGVLATPGLSGCLFESRTTSGGAATLLGSYPVNYPFTWLRLQRAGNLFTGYASLDGEIWTQLGSAMMALTNPVYLGLAAASHDMTQTVLAQFRDYGSTTAFKTSALPPAFETLGPSSRRTGLVITEIMYHPAPRADGKNLEFIELYNSQPFPEDMGGFRLTGAVDYTFPEGTVLGGGQFVVVAQAPADVQDVYSLTQVLGGYTNRLSHSGGTIRLRNRVGAIMLEVTYSDGLPWPVMADGAGHSLVLVRPSFGEGRAEAWAASSRKGGSPGAVEAVWPDPYRSIGLNELWARADSSENNFIELHNRGNLIVDVSGCFLSDDPATNKFSIPAGTVIPARGFVTFYLTNLNFALDGAGQTIYLTNPEDTRVIDAVQFGATGQGIALGRYPDGHGVFRELSSPTPGAANAALRVQDVVINEIMYQPISGDSDDEYVELYNQGTNTVDLTGWKFVSGINFTLPVGTLLVPGGYLVVAKNAARLISNYPQLNATNTVGDYGGTLANGGERLVLSRPEWLRATNASQIATSNRVSVAVADVAWQTGGRWPHWANGGGSSLELIDPRGDPCLAGNWADSDESAKSSWTFVETTGVLDNGTGTPDSLQMFLQEEGECLVDDVEVFRSGGNNLIANSSFENGATGWVAEGNQDVSGSETVEGYQSAKSFHIRAVGRGDTGANRVRTPLTTALAAGNTATIRAKVRWLKGQPEMLLRLRGNYLEAVGRMTLPRNLGTPGLPNSRALPNAGPAIQDVVHYPVLPAANQPVVISARLHDPDGIGQIMVQYRVDPATAVTSVAMRDDGAAGDAVAGDGIFSGTIPGQAAGVIVAFHIEAKDKTAAAVTTQFPSDAPERECLIRFGEVQPYGNLGTYRIWMTQATFNRWSSRNKLDNTPLDITFVYNDQRVIYNAQGLYAGSPYISGGYNNPSGTLCGYTLILPVDDPMLGGPNVVLDWPGRDNMAVQEQLVYFMADRIGLVNSYRRFIHLHINGVDEQQRGSIYEDVQQPGGDMIRQWFADDTGGDFYKIERWFEFNDTGGLMSDPMPTLQDFTTTGGIKKLARYRWNWMPRAITDSANNYSNLLAVVDAVNATAPEPYTSQTEALVDIEQWMRIFAIEHIANNFDSYGHEIGKNMYAYQPPHGRWQMMMWDIDWVMTTSAGHNEPGGNAYSPTSSLFIVQDPTVARMYNHPPFLRAYWRAVQDAVKGPLVSSVIEPIMDVKYAALVANGVNRSAGQNLQPPAALKTWIRQRRDYLVQQLAAVAAPFAILSNGGQDFNTNQNQVTLTGTAPIEVKSLRVNGDEYPVMWTSVTHWSLRLVLQPGTNQFAIQGLDGNGLVLSNATGSLAIGYTGIEELPQDHLVINEIMHHPIVLGAAYVELLNTAQYTAFDLSGWRLKGVDFTFAEGAVIPPGGYVVVVENRAAFAAAYGNTIPMAGEFAGHLDLDGETLSLIQPGVTPTEDRVINEVTYGVAAPWPAAANGTGASLQLVDPAQDNNRVANWAVAANSTNASAPAWQYVSVTGTASSSRLYVYLTSAGEVYLDDLTLVAGNVPEAGTNFLKNGGFESPLAGTWTISSNHAGTTNSAQIKHSGGASLHLLASSGGTTQGSSVWQDTYTLISGATYTLSYWYLPSTDGTGLTVRLSGNGIQSSHSIAPPLENSPLYTPGATNSVQGTLPAFPPLWLNEVQEVNLTGLADRAGHRHAWVELYNGGTNDLNLDGFYLSDAYTNLTRWAFPSNTVIRAGQFLVVWCDGETNETTGTELHASFSLAPSIGTVALARWQNGQPMVLDYLNYPDLSADRSFGAYPDGHRKGGDVFFYATPGAANNNALPPIRVFINEWMANNTRTLADPADLNFEDWFELFNAGTNAVDLAGYTLTDTLTNAAQFVIPAGVVIPAGGFLLVWADGEPAQTQGANLHVNFKLNQNGEAIALFSPGGTLIDAVSFGLQKADVSEGRAPDGQTHIVTLASPTPGLANSGGIAPPVLRLTTADLTAGKATVLWEAIAGQTFLIQYKNRLEEPVWSDYGMVAATGATATFSDELGTNQQRFYRILRNP